MEELKFGPPISITTIDNQLRLNLLNDGMVQKQDVRDILAGHLEDEKAYSKFLVEKFKTNILEYVTQYINNIKLDRKIDNESYKLFLNTLWINRQKAGEHNPPHNHSNGQISFVIYLDFPDEIKREAPFSKNSCNAGSISFFYGTDTHVESNNEYNFPHRLLSPVNIIEHTPSSGEMIIFPSYLIHYVSPFYTTNVERVSVSGNVSIIGTNNKSIL